MQAIGDMTVNPTTSSSSGASSVVSQQGNAGPVAPERASASPYGFDDDFSDNLPAAAAIPSDPARRGVWLGEADAAAPSSGSSRMYSDWNTPTPHRMSTSAAQTVQTAHVRPFIVAATSQGDRQGVVQQLR